MYPQTAAQNNGKTTRYFKGYQAQACAYEAAETYMDRGPYEVDDDVLEQAHDDVPGFDDEEYWVGQIMARNNLTTRDQYERWFDDAVEAFEEARYERLLLDAERD